MNLFALIKKVLLNRYRRNISKRADRIIGEIENSFQHYRKVMENCINYLTEFSKSINPYKCMKCGKVFFIINSVDKECPFCSSQYIVGLDSIDFKIQVSEYCNSLYGKNILYIETIKDVAERLCIDRSCYFLESTISLEIFIEKGILRISFKDEGIIEIELPWVDTSTIIYIDKITSIISTHREKLLKNGIKYIVYKTYYENIAVSYIKIIKEKFIDIYFFKHFINKLGLSNHIYSRGILVKIFDIEQEDYIDPQKYLLKRRNYNIIL